MPQSRAVVRHPGRRGIAQHNRAKALLLDHGHRVIGEAIKHIAQGFVSAFIIAISG